MRCAICSLRPSSDDELQCPACARASLYPIRIRHARVLLEREQLGKTVQDLSGPGASGGKNFPVDDGEQRPALANVPPSVKHTENLSHLVESKARILCIMQHAVQLKAQMERFKTETAVKKKTIEERRQHLRQAKSTVKKRRNESLESPRSQVKKTTRRYSNVSRDIVSSRITLCKTAASLAGLKRLPRVGPGSRGYEYFLGGLPLLDIRQFNNASPEQVTASLCLIARLLMLGCHYLQIRLPAQIFLPHREHPQATILSPSSSYTGRSVPLRGPAPTQSFIGTPKSSKELETRVAGRPRPLFLDRKLPRLAKDDSVTYALFVEGVALLAWDVAWLCRTQGLSIASSEWEDVCDIGRNLWLLFVAAPRAATAAKRKNDAASKRDQVNDAQPLAVALNGPSSEHALGLYSHGSASNFLRGAITPQSGSVDVSIRGWKFASPVKIQHELKSALVNEMSGHDWELLDGHIFEEDDSVSIRHGEEGVIVGSSKRRDSGIEEGRVKGASGWMKVRDRNP